MKTKRISLNEIFDPNSKYIKQLSVNFLNQYGTEFDDILYLSKKYGCSMHEIDPNILDDNDMQKYQKIMEK